MQTRNPQIDSNLLKLISEIDEFKGAWRALGALKPEVLSSLRTIAGIESVGSSTRIEGSKLSDSDVEKLLSNLEIQNFESRDEQEVAGYAELMNEVFDSYSAIPLKENHIKQLHKILLKYSTKDERHRGEYKKAANHVEAFDIKGEKVGVVFETATPFEAPRLMEELVQWTSDSINSEAHHPLIIIGVFVVEFLAIHPFQDGNGRLSRALTTLLLLRAGYDYVAYSSLEAVIEKSKDRYYLSLRKTQQSLSLKEANYAPWLLYFLTALKSQKDSLLRKVEREKKILGPLPELAATILQLARERGRITTSEIEQFTSQPRSTIKKRLNELTASSLLIRHGQGRSTWYSLK